MIIAIDFDGTIVEERYPAIGKAKPFAFDVLKKLHNEGHILILWTLRRGTSLKEAVKYCSDNGITFDAVNCNLNENMEEHIGKIYADIYIDDRNVGGMPDWGTIYNLIHNNISLDELHRSNEPEQSHSLFSRLIKCFKRG